MKQGFPQRVTIDLVTTGQNKIHCLAENIESASIDNRIGI